LSLFPPDLLSLLASCCNPLLHQPLVRRTGLLSQHVRQWYQRALQPVMR